MKRGTLYLEYAATGAWRGTTWGTDVELLNSDAAISIADNGERRCGNLHCEERGTENWGRSVGTGSKETEKWKQ